MSHFCTVEELDPHEQQDCYFRKGGISAYGVLKTGHGITNFSNGTQLQAAITAGTLVIAKKVKCIYPKPSPVEGENPVACGTETIIDGYDHTLEITDYNVSQANDVFYTQLGNSEFSGLIWYYCEEEEIRVVERGVRFESPAPESGANNKEKQKYTPVAKWYTEVSNSFPVLHEAPAGIFS